MRHEIIAQDTATNGEDYYMVSTVALGDGFETMVFHADTKGNVTDWAELDCNRYGTRYAATQGHKTMLRKWSKR